LVEGHTFYHYDGGLTTPLCDEIVWWNLSDAVMDISVRQFNDFADIILNTQVEKDGQCQKTTVANKAGSTSRPVQPLYGRTIDRICPSYMSPPSCKPSPPSIETNPTPVPTNCVDSPLTMLVDSVERTCAWVASTNTAKRCSRSFVRDDCPATCNGDCVAESKMRFEVDGKGFRTCNWVAEKSTVWRCNNFTGLKDTCRK